jgi:Glycosyl hydrolases family 25
MEVHSAQGRDVSNFQAKYAWSATTGLSFGIYRLTQGLGRPGTNSPDPYAQWNHDQIKAKGLVHGAYHFFDPGLSGPAQAEYFVTQHSIIGLSDGDMLWLDNESASGVAPAQGQSDARRHDRVGIAMLETGRDLDNIILHIDSRSHDGGWILTRPRGTRAWRQPNLVLAKNSANMRSI